MRPHLLLVTVALSGCRDAPAVDPLIEPVPEAAPASPRVSAPAGSVVPGEEERARVETRHRDQGCEPSAADAKPLELVKLQLTSKVEEREPVDVIDHARAGDHVWAYLEVANGSEIGRCVAVVFRVDGGKRAALTLDVGPSPRWRTWAKNRMVEADVGKTLAVEVHDDQGRVLERRAIPIAPSEG